MIKLRFELESIWLAGRIAIHCIAIAANHPHLRATFAGLKVLDLFSGGVAAAFFFVLVVYHVMDLIVCVFLVLVFR